MPTLDWKFFGIILKLGDDTYLSKALLFPEFSCLTNQPVKAHGALSANIAQVLENLPLGTVHRRQLSDPIELRQWNLDLNPPKGVFWREPINLEFSGVTWQHGDAQLAYLPELEEMVIVSGTGDLNEEVLKQIRQHILRTESNLSLYKLLLLQQAEEIQTCYLTQQITLLRPKQVMSKKDDDPEKKKSVLEQVATNLNSGFLSVAYEVDELVESLAAALTGRVQRSVLLVGASGTGKTAIFHELVRTRNKYNLGHTPFWATSGSRLVAGMTGFGMWQERCLDVWREATHTKALLHLGNLVELMEVGKSVSNEQGIASFFRSYLARGDMLVVAECTPEQITVIEREDPHLLQVFHRIDISEPSLEVGQKILRRVASDLVPGREVVLDDLGIETLDRLHRRYATYSAYPGRPLRFLKNLIQDAVEGSTLTTTEVTQTFSRETGLPLFLLDESIPLDLESVHSWFSQQVIGQPQAVDLVVDLLAAIKAGVTRPNRPLSSFLFVGPTGVGKTEMAKALAEFLFRDRTRMTRFDMSEFATPAGILRLIGGLGLAEGLLTAKVREQPFSVILFDEVEKAHPMFFDLLLQVIGEGRLTDASGRLADFRNAVVIMTSNLGAESYRRNTIGFGDDRQPEAVVRHFVEAVRSYLRPEMFNRIDRIVPFGPLSPETIVAVARREIDLMQRREGIKFRNLHLDVSPEVPDFLAARGYDVVYGARPLKRCLERELLVPLSAALNRYAQSLPLRAAVSVAGETLSVMVQPREDGSTKASAVRLAESRLRDLAERSSEFVRNVLKLTHSIAFTNLRNEKYRVERSIQQQQKKKHAPALGALLARLPILKQLTIRGGELEEKSRTLENQILLDFYQHNLKELKPYQLELEQLAEMRSRLLIDMFALTFEEPDHVIVAVYGKNPEFICELVSWYLAVAARHQWAVKLIQYSQPKEKSKEPLSLESTVVEKPDEFFKDPPKVLPGMVIQLDGSQAGLLMLAESGLHVFEKNTKTIGCLVETSSASLAAYEPIVWAELPEKLDAAEKRRIYSVDEGKVTDPLLSRVFPKAFLLGQSQSEPARPFAEAIRLATEQYLYKCAEEHLE
ncbi:MAG: AAA family ATPase [Acidobacteria bacterium]|nr:AAA family ATPase [Acidobacteriota bacterium]